MIKMRFYFAILTVFALGQAARATITIQSVTGYSNYVIVNSPTVPTTPGTPGSTGPTSTTQTYTIYGGLAGPATGTTNSDSTINNCVGINFGTDNSQCNSSRVTDTTQLGITFTSSASAGYPILYAPVNGQDEVLNSTSVMTNYAAQGSSAAMQIPWSALCASQGASGCDNGGSPLSSMITIQATIALSTTMNSMTGVQSDTFPLTIIIIPTVDTRSPSGLADACGTGTDEGACDFQLFPGDSKAYVTNVTVPSTFPATAGGSTFTKIRFFASSTNTTPYPYDSQTLSPPTDFTMTSSGAGQGSISGNNYITGLTNGTQYFFTMASLDLANNMSFFVAPGNTNYHTVIPSAVDGLLAKQFNCFIATAAYGSPFAAKVETFREFRDAFLIPSNWGRKFVKFYYQHSPYWANKIHDSDSLRAAARVTLYPAWAFAWAAVHWGFDIASILVVLLVSLPVGLWLLLKRSA